MSKKLKIALIILVVGVLSAVVVWKLVHIKADVSVGSKKADLIIKASALLQKDESNEDSANILYLNKIIAVSGTIDNINHNDQGVSIYLKNKEDVSGVMCSFDNSAIDTAIVKRGQQIKVKGICTGYLMDVVLSKCALEK
jgi:hypothetical protein